MDQQCVMKLVGQGRIPGSSLRKYEKVVDPIAGVHHSCGQEANQASTGVQTQMVRKSCDPRAGDNRSHGCQGREGSKFEHSRQDGQVIDSSKFAFKSA